MSPASPVYLALPPGPVRDHFVQALPSARLLDEEDPLADLDGCVPGVVVVDGARSLARALELYDALADDAWRVATPLPGAPVRLRALSASRAHDLDELATVGEEGEGASGAGVLLDLQRVLKEISRARHDLNNPLTSALAEVQLMLLDARSDEEREGLEVVQEQLRRIRDLIAATGHLRPPRQP